MTSHELGRLLLTGKDLPIIVVNNGENRDPFEPKEILTQSLEDFQSINQKFSELISELFPGKDIIPADEIPYQELDIIRASYPKIPIIII